MSRQKFEKTFNTFTKGLVTEASELNFPEDSSLYEKNFVLYRDGGRDRRKGMELRYPLGLTLTSNLYPLEFDDSLGVRGLAPSASYMTPPLDQLSVSALAPKVVRTDMVRYIEYDKWPPETISVAALAPSVVREDQVRYLTYDSGAETLAVAAIAPTVVRATVAVYLEYEIEPESISVAAIAPTVTRTQT